MFTLADIASGPAIVTIGLVGGGALFLAVALAASARLLPGHPATAAGLALGLAIAIGGVPALGGLGPAIAAPAALSAILTAAALALWWAVRQVAGRKSQVAGRS